MKLTDQQIEARAQAFEDAANHLRQCVTDDDDSVIPECPGLEREQYDIAADQILRWSNRWYAKLNRRLYI